MKTFTAKEIREICKRLIAINAEFGTNEKAIKSHANAYELLCLILEGRSEE